MASNDDLNQRITEKIQNQLLDIMPEEDIRKRVDAVIDNFFREKKPEYSGRPPIPSDFARIVGEMLEKKAKETAEAILQSPEWKIEINNEMKVSIGSAMQFILGIDPAIIEKVAARNTGYILALNVLSLIRETMMNSGNHNLASAIQTQMNELGNRSFR